MPAVVFVTAHDEYAIRAFEVQALDYLLKPFDRERFEGAMTRAKAAARAAGTARLGRRIDALLEQLDRREGPRPLRRLVVKTGGRVFFVEVDDIDWIEAAGNYVELHIGQETHLVRATMKGLEEALDPTRFMRVHRSTIVNIDRIREVQPWFNGDFVLVMATGHEIRTGRSYRDAIKSLLDNPV